MMKHHKSLCYRHNIQSATNTTPYLLLVSDPSPVAYIDCKYVSLDSLGFQGTTEDSWEAQGPWIQRNNIGLLGSPGTLDSKEQHRIPGKPRDPWIP